MAIKKHIPNLLTLGNLACGIYGIIVLFDPSKTTDPILPFYLMILAGIFDFFDGFVARLLHVQGQLGAELDSLADMVTFGVLPSLILYNWMNEIDLYGFLAYGGLVIGLMSAYRLALFNIDTRQSYGFIGLPTPANALFIGGLYYWHQLLVNFDNRYGLYIFLTISLVFSFLLISNIPMIALKFKKEESKFQLKRKIALVTCVVISIIVFGLKGISLSILAYVLLSIIVAQIDRTKVSKKSFKKR